MPGRITIELTDEEAKALGQLSEDTDLPQDRVMIQALRIYQAAMANNLAPLIASHVFDVGTFNNCSRPVRIAYKVDGFPEGERENGGLCESALARVIAEALTTDPKQPAM